MIHPLAHFPLQDILQFLQIEHHSRRRVRLARHRHFQNVIVSVPVRIIALAEDAAILLRREIRVVIEVRRGKLDFARHSNHGVFAAYSLPFQTTFPVVLFHHDSISAAL